MKTLNTFLRKLPELAVDNILVVNDDKWTEYHLSNGCYKFRKIGYNTYAVDKVTDSKATYHAEWDSSETCGDVFIDRLVLTLHGVRLILGDDVPDQF